MRVCKPDALALDVVVQPLSTGGYQYRWTITIACTCHHPDISLSLIRFGAEFVSQAAHAPDIKALLFVLDYADTP